MDASSQAIEWLLEGDPAIRWQVMRDLLDAPEEEWLAERQRTLALGWGETLLSHQDPDGGWGGGIYSPKWISATYTLLSLCDIGIPGDCSTAQRGARLAIDGLLGETRSDAFPKNLAGQDRCITGMSLRLAAYFGIQDARVEAIVDNLLAEQMPDEGWNCRRHRKPKPHHSSFHTTLNVLDGLREYVEQGGDYRREDILSAEERALDLLAQHRLVKSDHTGEVIRPAWELLSFPFRWHYDFLRGLAYFARSKARRDPRLGEAIDLLRAKRGADGLWPLENKYSGKVFFDYEKVGRPSRWVTLSALRILRWWAAG